MILFSIIKLFIFIEYYLSIPLSDQIIFLHKRLQIISHLSGPSHLFLSRQSKHSRKRIGINKGASIM